MTPEEQAVINAAKDVVDYDPQNDRLRPELDKALGKLYWAVDALYVKEEEEEKERQT